MQTENGRLKIHTSMRPEEQKTVREEKNAAEEDKKERKGLHLPDCGSFRRIRTEARAKRPRTAQGGMTPGERLLRNTAVACALLLTVMSLKNVDQPWSRKMTEGVRQAMTMRIDWDETLGRLSFVRALVPETALVFLDLGERADLTAPVSGEISHEYTEGQPWIEYACESAQQVLAASDGVVTAAGQGAGGDWIVLIQSEGGMETVYGYLESVYVRAGQEVKAAQQIGATAGSGESRLYFELRKNGEAINPVGRMK